MKKIGVLIGRFQVPEPHEGHVFLMKRILEVSNELLILVGSANKARSMKNPYTFLERRTAIFKVLGEGNTMRVNVLPLNDYLYSDDQWMADVAATINQTLGNQKAEVTLYGHFKEGNDYLKWFPQFKYQNIESTIETSGTELRNAHRHLLPQMVQQEYAQYEEDRQKFINYPYPDCLQANCGDAVVVCLGHVLLIQRENGTWALPGGHKHNYENFLDCAIREMYEETNLRVPEKVIRGSIKRTHLFDHPSRSGGFVPKVTVAVLIHIEPDSNGKLPRTSCASDAINTKFVPIEQAVNYMRLHDDHSEIISEMTGVKPVLAVNNWSMYSDD